MWLDRFSGHSTPSGSPPPPHNRSYSPTPRRPSGLEPGGNSRPSYGPRTSSLSINGRVNTSTASLNSSKVPNGSTLRRQISPPAEFNDPLEVLEAIIGRSLSPEGKGNAQNERSDDDAVVQRPTELVTEIDFGRLSLGDFSQPSQYEGEDDDAGSGMFTDSVEECEYVCTIGGELA